MRCQSCIQVKVADIRSREILLKPSFKDLRISADSGCDLCGVCHAAITSSYRGVITQFQGNDVKVLDVLNIGQNPNGDDALNTRVYLEGVLSDYTECDKMEDHKTEQATVRVGESGEAHKSTSAYFKIGVDPGSVLTKYISGRVPSRSPGDPLAMTSIRTWLETCDQRHSACSFLSADSPLPKRILDITGKPVVCITNGTQGRYVALSYCWGPSGKNILLTTSNFDDFTTIGINEGTLPATIRDAITVCRSLGLRYLWIDALCIIQRQPDYKDFIEQAPKMCDYYRNAYLTLIAGSAQDCADGFLHHPRNVGSESCELEYDRSLWPSDKDTNMTGLVKLFLPSSQDRGPIQERAWTFQESTLSQRSLIFGSEQLRFICPTYSIFEDGAFQKIHSPLESLSNDPAGYPQIHHLVRHGKPAEVLTRAFDFWFGLLYGYTSRKLTEPLDKLAAIAGYASLLQTIVKCRYIYGLWEDALPRGLLWKTQKPRVVTPRSGLVSRAVNRAPSWSWASIDGPIVHSFSSNTSQDRFKDPEFFRLEILSFANLATSFDPLRTVKVLPEAFELTVRGLLKEVWHIPPTSTNRASEFKLSDSRPASPANPASSQSNSPQNDVAVGSWDTYEDYDKKTYWDKELHALLMTPQTGLLLTHVGGKNYRRIGHFSKAKEEVFEDVQVEEFNLI